MRPPQGSEDSSRFNLSAATLRFPQISLFVLLVVAIAGTMAFLQLGQREDPDFTFRAMVVRTLWPGATTEQIDQQVTDRLEKTLQEVPYFKWTRSYSKPGESLIVLELLDTAPGKEVPQIWYQVRKKIGDVRRTLPLEVLGPFFNDEFGDVFGTIYAFTGDGFSMPQLKVHAEAIRQELLRLPDVAKVELIGTQDERIYVEISTARMATLGIDPNRIAEQLAAQNIVAPAGTVHTPDRSVPLRVTGQFDTVKEIEELRLSVGGRVIRLGDISRVYRGQVEPPVYTMRFGGKQAIGIAVSMTGTGDVLKLGTNLAATMARLEADLPIGIEFAKVSDQPRIVRGAVGVFVRALFEAVAIVLVVSFISLGVRAGMVVALVIPLVLAATFLGMKIFGIDLHRVSTGALVIALGLLVDDAMIAVEMMTRKIEEGFDTLPGRHFRLHQHRLPDAHRHADHRGRVSADRHREIDHRRVHLRDLRGGDHGPADLLGHGRDRRALHRQIRAEGKRDRRPRSIRYPLLSHAARPDRALHASSLADTAGDDRVHGPRSWSACRLPRSSSSPVPTAPN